MLANGDNIDTCQKLNNISGRVKVRAAKVNTSASFIARVSVTYLNRFL
jgi:hypothetical protein